MIGYELGRGFAYRRIVHPEMHWYATTIPFISAATIFVIYLIMPKSLPIIGKDGIFSLGLSILSTLPGFYFAGLAAVSTFNGVNMDIVMPSPAPKITVKVGNHSQDIELSRRQFLSYLFSYLVILSFMLCAAILFLNSFEPTLGLMKNWLSGVKFGDIGWMLFSHVGLMVFIFGACSMVVTTLHGIFFLTERMHQP